MADTVGQFQRVSTFYIYSHSITRPAITQAMLWPVAFDGRPVFIILFT